MGKVSTITMEVTASKAALAGALVGVINQLIAEIEADIDSPEGAAFDAKQSYEALRRAHNKLIDCDADKASAGGAA